MMGTLLTIQRKCELFLPVRRQPFNRLSDALRHVPITVERARLIPAMGIEMIEVGEASGALSPMLASVAEFYEDETNQRIGTLIAVVEPAILVFMAIVIAFILISL